MSTEIDLTQEAVQGYLSKPNESCPFEPRSMAANAWRVGRWLRSEGYPQPTTATARTYSTQISIGPSLTFYVSDDYSVWRT